MPNHNSGVVQIVDALPPLDDGHRHTMKIDPEVMAENLSRMVKTLGQTNRKIALVAGEDERSQSAYKGNGYDIHTINGDRGAELLRFIRQKQVEIRNDLPEYLVLVSDDPHFTVLCDALREQVKLSVWANSATVPDDLKQSSPNFRALEELLPNLKIPQIDIRIDLENIFIGLVKRGWRPNLHELIAAIRKAMDEKCRGEIVSITGYADFDELNRHHGGPNINWQRELTLAGGESRYVVNQHGKNTADMKIADDIRTVVEHDSSMGGVIDVIGLATMDRDFRHVVERVKSRGKKAIVLGLRDGLSRELENIASDVCYLDQYLKMPQAGRPEAQRSAPLQQREAALMMRIAAWMNHNRWRFVFRDKLEQEFSEDCEGLGKLIAGGWLTATRNSSFDAQGQARVLEPNPDHADACAAYQLGRWVVGRVDFCLNRKAPPMPYVDSNYLATGMVRDTVLAQMGVGQTRQDAERWLDVAASAGVVVAREIENPKSPGKYIRTWYLPERTDAASATRVEEAESTEPPVAQVVDFGKTTPNPQPRLTQLRSLLTGGLGDNDLNGLLLDHFTEVFRKVEGSAKYEKVQALLDYVELRKEYDKLEAALCEKAPWLFEQPEVQQEAA